MRSATERPWRCPPIFAPIITDRELFRELAKQAINRTLQDIRAAKQEDASESASRRAQGKEERTPQQKLEAEHRAAFAS